MVTSKKYQFVITLKELQDTFTIFNKMDFDMTPQSIKATPLNEPVHHKIKSRP